MNIMRKTSLITRLMIVGLLGLILGACANTMEGVGKDLQNMGTSMDPKSSTNNASQTKGKDVVVTPVK
jgi:predicted small secreted protein